MIDANIDQTRRQRLARFEIEGHALLANLLLYRLAIVNLLGLLFLGYAQMAGWNQRVIDSDHTGIIWGVVGLFVLFQCSLFVRAAKVTALLNSLKRGDAVSVNGEKFKEKNAHLDEMPGWMMFVGLIGNVVGIMMSIDAAKETLSGADGGITALLASLGVAFSATVASGVLGLWADIQRRILRTATVLMIEDAEKAGVPL